jgi:hypothetical protein
MAFLCTLRRNGEVGVEAFANAFKQLCRSVQVNFGARDNVRSNQNRKFTRTLSVELGAVPLSDDLLRLSWSHIIELGRIDDALKPLLAVYTNNYVYVA